MNEPVPFKHPPSHLDIESPHFAGKPHAWIQWKGTDVCCDLYCDCGWSGHFDGDFMYYVRCPACKQIWETGTHITLYKVTDNRADGSAAIAEPDL